MDDYDSVDLDDLLRIARRYRKKLRQIERLESIGRALSDEEEYKVNSKNSIRLKLKEVVEAVNVQEYLLRRDQSEEEEPSPEDYEGDDSTNVEGSSPAPSAKPVNPLQVQEEFVASDFSPLVEASQQVTVDTSSETSKIHVSHPEHVPQESTKVKQQRAHIKIRKSWKNKSFDIISLEGHSDIICDVDAHHGWLVSGSRDTSIKLWDLSTNTELKNVSGHSGIVTCVKLLSSSESNTLREHVIVDMNEMMLDIKEKTYDKELMLLSASTDCTIKLWLLPQGSLVKSIYNYSPITAMLYSCGVVFVGSDSGKFTAYNLMNGDLLCDMMMHENTITCLKCFGDRILSTSIDGDLKLWKVCRVDKEIELDLKYSLANHEMHVQGREILAACGCGGKIIYGDDGMNLKVIDATTDILSRYPNHARSSGFTDSVDFAGNILIATSYDVDSGRGSLNVRYVDKEASLPYIASLAHPDVPRLLCLTIDSLNNSNKIITGGVRLLVWIEAAEDHSASEFTFEDHGKVQVKTKTIPELTKISNFSDVESDATAEDEDEKESSFWWWSKPGTTGSKQPMDDENSYTDSCSSDSDQSSTEYPDSEPSSSWWCTIV